MVDDILQSLEEKVVRYRLKKGLYRIKIQSISNNKILRIPHPPYTPDIAPCDFWLFGKLKEYLKVNHFKIFLNLTDSIYV